ncbi:hypothetical protein U9M48_007869 [Paspalum notatum var. saurae]|uniref:Uncharacterized protein n=1 Tax=Paspalum notatum var. saurae TaxID=547442 RepID=A0AAQ3WCJ7_PASNO
MVDAWWPLLGAAVPALVAGQFIRIKRRHDKEQRLKAARGREKSSDEVFVCERVCTSKRMLKKVRAFFKDPIPETCVTVRNVFMAIARSQQTERAIRPAEERSRAQKKWATSTAFIKMTAVGSCVANRN